MNKYPSFRQFITGQAAPPIILCIGSPKVPGDSFGPITGKLLCERFFVPTDVYGTCDCPVHALNLTAELEKIRLIHPDRKIIAVDSAICASVRTGTLSAFPGSIRPGLGRLVAYRNSCKARQKRTFFYWHRIRLCAFRQSRAYDKSGVPRRQCASCRKKNTNIII